MKMAHSLDAGPVYDRLWSRLLMAMPVGRNWNMGLHAGGGAYVRFGLGESHPSLAFPDIGAPLTAVLLVVTKPTGLVLRLEAEWTTGHGIFKSIGQYSAGKAAADVVTTGAWEKHLPSRINGTASHHVSRVILDDDYRAVMERILESGRPIAQMLIDRHYPDVLPGIFAAAALEAERLLPGT